MSIDLAGCTRVRFGIFLAMTGSQDLAETDAQPVWKVWCDEDEGKPGKIAEGLTREDAIRVAQACANEWRRQGKPTVRGVTLFSEEFGRESFRLTINGASSLV